MAAAPVAAATPVAIAPMAAAPMAAAAPLANLCLIHNNFFPVGILMYLDD